MKKLYVGNLDWGMSEEDLKEVFSQFGAIEEAVIITDRATGRSKGFGFVTFASDGDADNAMQLNGQDVNGRKVTVSVARPPRER